MHMVAPNSASYSRGSFIVAIDLVHSRITPRFSQEKNKRSNGHQSIRREEYHSRDSRAGMGRHGGLGMDIQHHPADDHRPRLLLHRRVAAQRILRQRRKRSSSGKEKRNQGGAVNDPSERRGECHLSWVAHTGRRGGGRRR